MIFYTIIVVSTLASFVLAIYAAGFMGFLMVLGAYALSGIVTALAFLLAMRVIDGPEFLRPRCKHCGKLN